MGTIFVARRPFRRLRLFKKKKKARNDGGRDVRNSGGKMCDWFKVGDEKGRKD